MTYHLRVDKGRREPPFYVSIPCKNNAMRPVIWLCVREFVAIRDGLAPAAVDPNSIVKDIRIDERKIPLIMEAVNSKGATFKLELDEVAIHGLVAELADNDLATLTTQGNG